MRKLRPCGLRVVFCMPLMAMFLVFLLSTASCAQDKLPDMKLDQNANKFVGCYELHLGRWWPWGMGEDTPFVTPPKRIELTLERGTEYFEKDHLLIRDSVNNSSRKSAFWFSKDNGAVLLVFTNGFSGVSVNLNKRRNELRGWAHAHFDFPRPPHIARAVAEPVPCSSMR